MGRWRASLLLAVGCWAATSGGAAAAVRCADEGTTQRCVVVDDQSGRVTFALCPPGGYLGESAAGDVVFSERCLLHAMRRDAAAAAALAADLLLAWQCDYGVRSC